MATVKNAVTPEEILRCFPVITELRTHLTDSAKFVEKVLRQQKEGYQLAYVEADGEVCACGGYRIFENLFQGKILYVDDLVSSSSVRSKGHGSLLIGWLEQQAWDNGCDDFCLDSGVQRFRAHKFYFKNNLAISCYHFSKQRPT